MSTHPHPATPASTAGGAPHAGAWPALPIYPHDSFRQKSCSHRQLPQHEVDPAPASPPPPQPLSHLRAAHTCGRLGSPCTPHLGQYTIRIYHHTLASPCTGTVHRVSGPLANGRLFLQTAPRPRFPGGHNAGRPRSSTPAPLDAPTCTRMFGPCSRSVFDAVAGSGKRWQAAVVNTQPLAYSRVKCVRLHCVRLRSGHAAARAGRAGRAEHVWTQMLDAKLAAAAVGAEQE